MSLSMLRYSSVFVAVLLLLSPSVLLSDSIDVTASNAALLEIKGELTQGGVVRGHLPPGSDIRLDGRNVAQTPEGYFVFGFGRDADAKATLTWVTLAGETQSKVLSVAQREYRTQYVEGVPQKTVTPAASKLARIRKETAMVKQARATDSQQLYFLSKFIIPLNGPITGVYGSQRVYNGVPKRPHFGIDYAAPTGTPVVAPADATVTLAHNDMYYSGGTMIMDHGYGLSSTFIHLSEVTVVVGQKVKQGDVVGKVGAGGRATGPHLDWRLNWFDVRLDPALLLSAPTLEGKVP